LLIKKEYAKRLGNVALELFYEMLYHKGFYRTFLKIKLGLAIQCGAPKIDKGTGLFKMLKNSQNVYAGQQISDWSEKKKIKNLFF
jgi:hypothetical protein